MSFDDDPPNKETGVVVCVRASDLDEDRFDIPELVKAYEPCHKCGESCVMSQDTIDLIKDPRVKVICETCAGPAALVELFSGEGVYLPPGTWELVRKVVSEEEYHRMRLFAVMHNIQEATVEEMLMREREKEIRQEFGT